MNVGRFLRRLARCFREPVLSVASGESGRFFRPEIEWLEDRLAPAVQPTSLPVLPGVFAGNQEVTRVLGPSPAAATQTGQPPSLSVPVAAQRVEASGVPVFLIADGIITTALDLGAFSISSIARSVAVSLNGSGRSDAVTVFEISLSLPRGAHAEDAHPEQGAEGDHAGLPALNGEILPEVAGLPLYGESVVEGTSVSGSDLILVATLFSGALRDSHSTPPVEENPSDDVFALLLPLRSRDRTKESFSSPGDEGPRDSQTADSPGEGSDGPTWVRFRLGVEDALRRREEKEVVQDSVKKMFDGAESQADQVADGSGPRSDARETRDAELRAERERDAATVE